MNTRGSVVVLPLVPFPKKIKFQSELHAILSYYIQRELRHVSNPVPLDAERSNARGPCSIPAETERKNLVALLRDQIFSFLAILLCFFLLYIFKVKIRGYILVHFLYWLRTALKSALLYLHTSTGSVQAST